MYQYLFNRLNWKGGGGGWQHIVKVIWYLYRLWKLHPVFVTAVVLSKTEGVGYVAIRKLGYVTVL